MNYRSDKALVLVPLFATIVVYIGVLDRGFYFDDFWHLYKMANWPLSQAVTMGHGGHLLHSFNLIVWLVLNTFGANATVFFVIALLAHLCSVRFIFLISSRMTNRVNLSAFFALLWGMCPFARGSLGWMSVHGQVYATAAILWVLLDILRRSQNDSPFTYIVLARHCFFLLVAATSFGTGFATTVVFFLAIALWNPNPNQRSRLLFTFGSFSLVVVMLYFYTMLSQVNFGGGTENVGPGKVDLLIESVKDLPSTVSAFFELLVIGSSGLIWGPLLIGEIRQVSTESLLSVSIFMALVFTGPLIIVANFYANARQRMLLCSLFVLTCAGYATISVARQQLLQNYSFNVSLGVAARYHYISTALMSIMFCLSVSIIADRYSLALMGRPRTLLAVWITLALVPYIYAVQRGNSAIHRNEIVQYDKAKAEIKKALELQADDDHIYIDNKVFATLLRGLDKRFPGYAGVFIVNYPENVVNGRQVFFLEQSKMIVDMAKAQKGTRVSLLLIHKPIISD